MTGHPVVRAVDVLAALGHGGVPLLVLAAVLLLDFAVQCHQALGRHEMYSLRGDARHASTPPS